MGRRTLPALCMSTCLSTSCLLGGCDEAAPRAQLVVVIDTDAPSVAQLRSQAGLSAAAAVDTVLVEVLEPAGEPPREVAATNATDWPLSFGIVTPDGGGGETVSLRLRAYAEGRFVNEGGQLLPELVIDRLVALTLPSDAVTTSVVSLRFDCFAKPVWLQEPATTCIAAGVDGEPSEGVETVEDVDAVHTAVGSAAGAHEVPCARSVPPRADAICIPGGFSFRGDLDVPFAPLQAVWTSPFWMDRTEYTVGRMRLLADQLSGPLPGAGSDCTWNGEDDLPVNCISRATAEEACMLDGGELPTTAQWEHAARGRGEGRRFPWGNDQPSCCTANIGNAACTPPGPAPVATHLPDPLCGPFGDLSRDGVVDMGGNVGELVRDKGQFACPMPPGIVVDPVCGEVGQEFRGGSWWLAIPSAMPGAANHDSEVGFRCVYPDLP